MPGFLGVVGHDPAWMDRTSALDAREQLAGHLRTPELDVRVIGRDARSAGYARLGDVELGLEGYVLADGRDGRQVAEGLLQRYTARGLDFVDELDGSFQLVIRDGRRLHLISDALGSRRPFFVHRGASLYLAPRASLLRGALPSPPLDGANLTQFLLFGRFFAGECALEPLRQLLPGEILTITEGQLSRRRWFRYQVAPDLAPDSPASPLDEAAALAELATRVDRAILATWEHMRSPAILLSGGYDSRYLLNVLLEHVPDRRAIRSVLWGVHLDQPGSDGAAAAALARRAGIEHLELERDLDALPAHLDELLEAQSGMTELAFGHADELAICRALADQHGVAALLRGDEVFGPTGQGPADLAEARARSCARHLTEADGAAGWFTDEPARFARTHAARVDELLRDCPRDALGLRDTLYARERLPAFTHQLTAHKLPALEVYNPLQALEVVRFYSALPSWCREDKALFKRSYHQRFSDTRDVPIATGGNGLDWGAFIPRSPAIQARLRQLLAALPPPLSAPFFLSQLELASRAASPPRAPSAPPSPAQLVMRAAVLGWWLAGS